MSKEDAGLMGVEETERALAPAVVVRLADKEWVAGCVWMSQPRSMTAAEIAEEASHLGANVYVLRQPHQAGVVGEAERHDVGYGSLPGVSRGLYYSLGAALAELRNDKWSATFDLGDGRFLYVAVVDGSIDASEHGEVVGDRETINRAIAAQAWNKLPHKEHSLAELEQILLDAGRPARMLFLGSRHSSATRFIAGVGAAVLILGGAAVMLHVHNAHQAAARARFAAVLREQREAASRQSAVGNPLLASPAPNVVLDACAKLASRIPLSDNGWVPQSFECGPRTAKIVWHATPAAWYAGRPAGVIGADAQTVVWSAPISLPNGPDSALPLSLSVAALLDLGKRAGLDLQLQSEQGPALPGATVVAPAAPVEGFELRSSWAPWSVPLASIPGLRIQSISTSGGEWSVKGAVYGTR